MLLIFKKVFVNIFEIDEEIMKYIGVVLFKVVNVIKCVFNFDGLNII